MDELYEFSELSICADMHVGIESITSEQTLEIYCFAYASSEAYAADVYRNQHVTLWTLIEK